MDGNSFDTLTRVFSATPSRRDLGRALAGLTAGGLPRTFAVSHNGGGATPEEAPAAEAAKEGPAPRL